MTDNAEWYRNALVTAIDAVKAIEDNAHDGEHYLIAGPDGPRVVEVLELLRDKHRIVAVAPDLLRACQLARLEIIEMANSPEWDGLWPTEVLVILDTAINKTTEATNG